MKHTVQDLHNDIAHALWRKLPLELLSALICLVVLHALTVSLFSDHGPSANGSYLALACVGCIIAVLSAFFTETSTRKLQSAGYMLANMIAMFCFY